METLTHEVTLDTWSQCAKVLRELKKRRHRDAGFYPVITELENGKFRVQVYQSKDR